MHFPALHADFAKQLLDVFGVSLVLFDVASGVATVVLWVHDVDLELITGLAFH